MQHSIKYKYMKTWARLLKLQSVRALSVKEIIVMLLHWSFIAAKFGREGKTDDMGNKKLNTLLSTITNTCNKTIVITGDTVLSKSNHQKHLQDTNRFLKNTIWNCTSPNQYIKILKRSFNLKSTRKQNHQFKRSTTSYR